MTGGTTPQFEIPTDMRKMTEQSMEQVRTAIDAYLDFFKRSVPEDILGGSALSDRILAYAGRHLASAFEFTGRLAQVKDLDGLAKLQMDFIQTQMQAVAEEAKYLSEAMTKAMMDNLKPPIKGSLSS